MKKTLLADAGSTKVAWAVIGDDTDIQFTTEGLNALMASPDDISNRLEQAHAQLISHGIPSEFDEIYFYGAGCATPAICKKMSDALSGRWSDAKIEVNSDLLAAARALLDTSRGIVCILGTGSNSCLYDGEKIVSNVPSLGFILGDEGSGAALGKRLVSDAFKGKLPDLIKQRFIAKHGLELADILDRVYRQSAPNRFLASLVPFLQENIWNPYIYSIVYQEFLTFLKRNVELYPGARTLPISFTGSIAFHFRDVLEKAASSLNLKIADVKPSPLEGLIKHHRNRQ